jgi:TRAP-type C4-dicarboxylate transport system substrate-binding protein
VPKTTRPACSPANHYSAGTKFYAQTNHLIIPEIFVMSKATWDKLSRTIRRW